MKNTNKTANVKNLAFMLGSGGVNGSVALAALSGLFTLQNAPLLAFSFMAGPGAILTASLMEGQMKERMLTALIAGLVATIIVIFAAGFGPKLLGFVNLNILKIVGGISIGAIALLIAGVKIPESLPLIIMIIGLIASLIWR